MNTEVLWRGRKQEGSNCRESGAGGGTDEITYWFLLHVECGDVDGAGSRLFPIYGHRVPIASG